MIERYENDDDPLQPRQERTNNGHHVKRSSHLVLGGMVAMGCIILAIVLTRAPTSTSDVSEASYHQKGSSPVTNLVDLTGVTMEGVAQSDQLSPSSSPTSHSVPSAASTLLPSSSPVESPSTPPSAPPTLTQANILLELMASIIDKETISNTGTPQYQAFDWLANRDTIDLIVEEGNPSIDILIQRYALATLYYATGGGSVRNNNTGTWYHDDNWLLGKSHCEWERVVCSGDGLYGLNLGK